MGQHQRLGAGGILHGSLRGRVELAPSRAFAVEQFFPAGRLRPRLQFFSGNALFFEVVKRMRLAVFGEPGAGFFDCVAVGNAVKGNHARILAR